MAGRGRSPKRQRARERLADVLPELAFWFHLQPDDLGALRRSEEATFVAALAKLPPLGAVRAIMVTTK